MNQQISNSEIASSEMPAFTDKRDFWNWRAKEFSEHAAGTAYPGAFIKIMRPRKNWSVFDMGCGGGTLAIPLALRVKSVTAADFSETMLEIVGKRCSNAGINNVNTLPLRWEDEWDLADNSFDVAIASRTLGGDNVKEYLTKLNRVARKAIYITTVVGTGPHDKLLYESTGRTFNVAQDYVYFFNILYEMGIMANVSYITEKHRNSWNNHDDAFNDQKWMFREMTAEEEKGVRTYLEHTLVRSGGQWMLPYSRDCHWAVMWWNKK